MPNTISKGLGEFYPLAVESILDLRRKLDKDSGIYVLNEHVLLNPERVDSLDRGQVSPQAVNLEQMTGNAQVLEAIEFMLSKKGCAFFPGTLIRNFDGIFLPTMPVIVNGKIVLERIKQSGLAYIEDKPELARRFVGPELADRLSRYQGPEFEGPAHEFNRLIEAKTQKLRSDSLRSVRIGEYNVLPVICNELSLIPEVYQGEKVNLIAHSCDNLFPDDESLFRAYEKFARRMIEKGLAETPLVFVTAQHRSHSPEYSIITDKLVYNKGSLQKI